MLVSETSQEPVFMSLFKPFPIMAYPPTQWLLSPPFCHIRFGQDPESLVGSMLGGYTLFKKTKTMFQSTAW